MIECVRLVHLHVPLQILSGHVFSKYCVLLRNMFVRRYILNVLVYLNATPVPSPLVLFFQFTEETQKAVWHVKGTTFLFFPYLENSDGICSYSLEMSCLNKQKRPLSNPQKLCCYRVSKTNFFWQNSFRNTFLTSCMVFLKVS